MVISLQDAIHLDPYLAWGLHPASAWAFWDHHLPTAGVVDIALKGDLPLEVSIGNHGRMGSLNGFAGESIIARGWG